MKLANQLYSNFIEYEPHKRLCQDRNWLCDFYLPKYDLWIEYDGLENRRLHPETYKEKIKYYQENRYNFMEIREKDKLFDKLALLNLDTSSLQIQQINYKQANEFLFRTHYLKKCS